MTNDRMQMQQGDIQAAAHKIHTGPQNRTHTNTHEGSLIYNRNTWNAFSGTFAIYKNKLVQMSARTGFY